MKGHVSEKTLSTFFDIIEKPQRGSNSLQRNKKINHDKLNGDLDKVKIYDEKNFTIDLIKMHNDV